MPDPAAETPDRGVPADPRTNVVVQFVLRSGLVGAMLLLAAGLSVQLASSRNVAVDVRMFDIFGAPSTGEALMGLGVLVLTLTPVAGIVSLLVSWWREHDRPFAGVAALVLLVLSAAVVVGLAG